METTTKPESDRQPEGSEDTTATEDTDTEPEGPGTLSGEPLKDLGEHEPSEDSLRTPRTGADAVRAVGSERALRDPESIAAETQMSATDWLLATEPTSGETATKTLKLNMGTPSEPIWIYWTIRGISLPEMRDIRKRAASTREAKETGNIDEYNVNTEIVATATVDPDLDKVAQELYQRDGIPPDKVALVRGRFSPKPGYIAQISGQITRLAGFDDDDVTDAEQVLAAGNS